MTRKFRGAIIFGTILLSHTIQCQAGKEAAAKPVVVYLDLLSKNSPTDQIVTTVLKNAPSLRREIGFANVAYLTWYIRTIVQWGEEIAAEDVKGFGNVTKLLAQRIQDELNVSISDKALPLLVDIATNPILNKENLALIQRLKDHRPIIGVSSQDPLEHEIYRKKMQRYIQENHTISLKSLVDPVVIIASCDDTDDHLSNPGYYQNENGWYITAKPYPSDYCRAAIVAALSSFGYEKDRFSIIDKQQKLYDICSKLPQ